MSYFKLKHPRTFNGVPKNTTRPFSLFSNQLVKLRNVIRHLSIDGDYSELGVQQPRLALSKQSNPSASLRQQPPIAHPLLCAQNSTSKDLSTGMASTKKLKMHKTPISRRRKIKDADYLRSYIRRIRGGGIGILGTIIELPEDSPDQTFCPRLPGKWRPRRVPRCPNLSSNISNCKWASQAELPMKLCSKTTLREISSSRKSAAPKSKICK